MSGRAVIVYLGTCEKQIQKSYVSIIELLSDPKIPKSDLSFGAIIETKYPSRIKTAKAYVHVVFYFAH